MGFLIVTAIFPSELTRTLKLLVQNITQTALSLCFPLNFTNLASIICIAQVHAQREAGWRGGEERGQRREKREGTTWGFLWFTNPASCQSVSCEDYYLLSKLTLIFRGATLERNKTRGHQGSILYQEINYVVEGWEISNIKYSLLSLVELLYLFKNNLFSLELTTYKL